MYLPTFTGSCPFQSVGTFRVLFNQLILSYLNTTCDITTSYPRGIDFYTLTSTRFDFIIVGAGSTGSVIASRLSEIENCNVLLIDAGDDPPIESDIPAFYLATIASPFTDFRYFAEESPTICRGAINNRCFLPRAKMLGGCSSHNTMIYARGSCHDYDGWAAEGNAGWDYASVLHYFKKLEYMSVESLCNADHGTSGPQYIQFFQNSSQAPINELEQSIYRAALEVGIPPAEDVATKTKTGAGRLLCTIKKYVRWNTARAYLSTICDRPNLFVLKRAHVTKILIDKHKRAYGVTIHKNNQFMDIRAYKEVIISAGAINSPQLLMLSGIGPKQQLDQFGIRPVQYLNVGDNFQDHYLFGGLFFTYSPFTSEFRKPSQLTNEILDSLYEYLTKHTGDLAKPADFGTEIFYDSTKTTADYPDLQLNFINMPFSQLPLFLSGLFKPEIAIDLLKSIRGEYVAIAFVTSLRPGIRGRVYLKSASPFVAPAIDLDYPRDSDLHRRRTRGILAGIELLERMNRTQSLRRKEIRLVKGYVKDCDGSWDCIIPYLSSTYYHHSGTCKMGPKADPRAVVDHTLKVHGLKKLRVADASIMPWVVAGNTNIPCMMIGEKCADMVKNDHGYK